MPKELLAKDLLDQDNPYWKPLNPIKDLVEWIQSNLGRAVHVCDSSDIDEELEHGDYSYYYFKEIVPYEIWFYMESTHPWGVPHRLIIFNPEKQTHINISTNKIVWYPVNMKWWNAFQLEERECIETIKELLRESDRPSLLKEADEYENEMNED